MRGLYPIPVENITILQTPGFVVECLLINFKVAIILDYPAYDLTLGERMARHYKQQLAPGCRKQPGARITSIL
jgi:hypothetical protein